MVEHIVLFKWNDDASAESIDAAMTALTGLKGQIEGVLDLSCGANYTDRAKGYTHGLVVRFDSKASLEAYGPHPAHQHVVQTYINPIRADILALDYEF